MAQDISSLLAGLPQLAQLLSMQTRNAQQQQPVREALNQQALNFLPKSSRAAFPGVTDVRAIPALPGGSGSASSDGGSLLASILKYLAAGGAGYAAGRYSAPGQPGSGGAMDLGKLGSALKNLMSRKNPNFQNGTFTGNSSVGSGDPFGDNLPGYDNFGYFNDPSVFSGMPNDPSSGSGVGPGMQAYYGSGSGGGGTNPWDE